MYRQKEEKMLCEVIEIQENSQDRRSVINSIVR